MQTTKLIAALLFAFITTCGALPAYSFEKNWRSFAKESDVAITQNNPILALALLRKAWQLAGSNTKVRMKLQSKFAISFEKNGNSERATLYRNATQAQMEELISKYREKCVESFVIWGLSSNSRTLALSILPFHPNSDPPLVNDSIDLEKHTYRAKSDEPVPQIHPPQKQLRDETRIPLIISPLDSRYKALVMLSYPLKDGEKKKVDFDLNPFLTKPWQIPEM